MEIIHCVCKVCDADLGDFANFWSQVGTSYFSPIVDPEQEVGIAPRGAPREGDQGTLIEGCELQDIQCRNCAALLGIKCLSTPINHVLDENQCLFKLSSFLALGKNDNRQVELVVKRHLKLRQASRSSAGHGEGDPHASRPGTSRGHYSSPPAGEAADISHLHAALQTLRADIDRIDSEGYKVITSLNDAVTRVECELGKMEAVLADLRRDISGNHDDTASLKSEIKAIKTQSQAGTAKNASAIDRLGDRIKSANAVIKDAQAALLELAGKVERELDSLRSEVRQNANDINGLKSAIKDRVTVRDHAKDMAAVRGELAQLRKQVEDSRGRPTAGAFPARELDILTSNISKIGNRANQVESLQMELEILKGRVERAEAAAAQPTPSQLHHQNDVPNARPVDTSAYDGYDDPDSSPASTRSSRRKRPSLGHNDTSPLARQKRTAAASPETGDLASSPAAPPPRRSRGKKPVKETAAKTRTQRARRSSLK